MNWLKQSNGEQTHHQSLYEFINFRFFCENNRLGENVHNEIWPESFWKWPVVFLSL